MNATPDRRNAAGSGRAPSANRGPAPPQAIESFDGILAVHKPSGPTSHDIVAKIRRHFRFRKVGHGGTLDPMATGLLVILIGRGTKLANQFIASDKTYEGAMRLGVETDSQDAQGKVTREADAAAVTREQLEAEMGKFRGDIFQIPPMVSAVKVDGVPLYKRARRGETIERKPRLIHIYEFSLVDFRPPLADFRLQCTKGTYARTLCADVGTGLGCGAHLQQLVRTRCGDITLEQAVPMDDIMRMNGPELLEKIIPIRRFSVFPGGQDPAPAERSGP